MACKYFESSILSKTNKYLIGETDPSILLMTICNIDIESKWKALHQVLKNMCKLVCQYIERQ